MTDSSIGAIILAAGYSSRMRDFKPLLKIGKLTAVERAIHSFKEAGIREIIVIIGHKGDEVAEGIADEPVKVVFNDQYHTGMYSSVVKGVSSLNEGIKAFFLLPVDIPLIKPKTIKEIIRFFQQNEKGIICPVFNGIKGHPPLISMKYREVILRSSLPEGMKSLLETYETDTAVIEVIDEGTIMDMDTPEDYKALTQYFELNDIPTDAECTAILSRFSISSNITEHGKKVASVACSMAEKLNEKGYNLNIDLIKAAGILHDIAKGRTSHAEVGEALLTEMGFPRIGRIIACHMNIDVKDFPDIPEEELVYIADKMVNKNKIHSLEERLCLSLKKYSEQTDIMDHIRVRFENAGTILDKIIRITGLSKDELISLNR